MNHLADNPDLQHRNSMFYIEGIGLFFKFILPIIAISFLLALSIAWHVTKSYVVFLCRRLSRRQKGKFDFDACWQDYFYD